MKNILRKIRNIFFPPQINVGETTIDFYIRVHGKEAYNLYLKPGIEHWNKTKQGNGCN